MNITYQKGFKFGAAVTSLGMYYTSNKICPRIKLRLRCCIRSQDILPSIIMKRKGLSNRGLLHPGNKEGFGWNEVLIREIFCEYTVENVFLRVLQPCSVFASTPCIC